MTANTVPRFAAAAAVSVAAAAALVTGTAGAAGAATAGSTPAASAATRSTGSAGSSASSALVVITQHGRTGQVASEVLGHGGAIERSLPDLDTLVVDGCRASHARSRRRRCSR